MPDETNPQDERTPKKGGFGAFSQQYRDRWAANHPHVGKPGVDATPAPASPRDAPDTDATLPESGRES